MAEVKNAFIKSKMNKDLDARLIPQGEYRDAVNIQVSKSEGDDVGALENVLGNFSLFDFENDSGVSNLHCIGYFVNEFNNTVYLFFTTNTDQPYSASEENFIYSYNVQSSIATKLVQGAFLNFSTLNPIIGVNVLEDFLFFTDNRNQPRKINVNLASTQGISYYINEDQISVAKYYPYKSIEVIKETSTDVYETTMYDAASEFIPLNNGAGGVPQGLNINNPYYESDFVGDPNFLEDKFVRFSYRFKFVDGEYSLIAPFTQSCFIPKQDGYFLEGDEEQTVASTVVEFMENKVNKIALQVPLPTKMDNTTATAAELNSLFHISEVDIIYKESDGLALQVVETLQVSDITGSNGFFEYVYNSTKPYKTLPENEITRVYDKIPVKALGQEVASNRVVYSNFQDKHTPPSGLKYQVAASEKYTNTGSNSSKSDVEYPNHSVKQNRNYQVAIVLADRYGRQSTAILSNDTNVGTNEFGADTVYLPYREENDSVSFLGDSLKISFNERINSTQNSTLLTPGLYAGNDNNTDYKPLGWYSYKVVVKQLEQEYYNVYAPGAIKGIPYYDTYSNPSIPLTEENASFITLLNDNINKVPRDLSEVGPQDKQFRSSVQLFGRVENTDIAFSNIGNQQYFPGRKSFTTNTIEDLFDLFDVSDFVGGNNDPVPITNTNNPYYAFYRSESNPFIAEFITSQKTEGQFGLNNVDYDNSTNTTYLKFENLTVFETAPTVSRLELFYETSTSDLISVLNLAIDSSGGGNSAVGVSDFDYTHNEGMAPRTVISGSTQASTFHFINFADDKITDATAEIDYVIDNTGSGVDIKSQFSLESVGGGDFRLKTAANTYFYYGSNPQPRQYTFGFNVTSDGSTSPITVNGNLENIDPIINNDNTNPIEVEVGTSTIISTLDGYNGSNTGNPDTNVYTQELTWSITNIQGEGVFVVSGNSIINTNASASGTSTFQLNLQDAGGATATPKTFTVYFGEPQVPSDFTNVTFDLIDGDGATVWFTDNTTNLESNPPDFGNAGTASTFLNGFDAPSSLNSTNDVRVCPQNQSFNAEFKNETKGTSLTQGTFYVRVQGVNQFIPDEDDELSTYVKTRWAIQYRQSSSDPDGWQSVADINNTSVSGTNVGAHYRYSDSDYNGMDVSTRDLLYMRQRYDSLNILGKGSKVFAFNRVGEYRVVYGNLASEFGEFTDSGVNCTDAGQQDIRSAGDLEIGDFYYPNFSWRGNDDGVYEYRLADNTSCSNTFTQTSTSYYAAEPFAKYVTQLYTDTSLLTPASSVNGTQRFRRLSQRDFATVSNPEQTKDGAYTATFSSGLRSGIPEPCLYP